MGDGCLFRQFAKKPPLGEQQEGSRGEPGRPWEASGDARGSSLPFVPSAEGPAGPGELPGPRYPAELTERYELLECLSAAAGWETLLARDRVTGDLCVAKCALGERAARIPAVPELLRGDGIAPLPRTLAEYRTKDMYCSLRQYVKGESLAAHRARRRFPERQVIRIGVDLCSQLRLLHSLDPPFLHLDVSPENVILRPDGTPVLIDFACSPFFRDGEDHAPQGTRGFAPPERYEGSPADPRSDLYSLGMLLQWMRGGRAQRPDRARLPLDRVILRCTDADPAARYADADELRRDLLVVRGKWLRVVAGTLMHLGGDAVRPLRRLRRRFSRARRAD